MKINIQPIPVLKNIESDWVNKINKKIEKDVEFINSLSDEFAYDQLIVKPKISENAEANVKYTMKFELDDDFVLNSLWHHYYPNFRKYFEAKWSHASILYITDSDIYDSVYVRIKMIIQCQDINLDAEFIDNAFQ